ncbi:MAG: tripartite tricarboxylate transporter substrate binding protein [Hyphomicrobiales bacterium]|nr:tripartite tricarboxylate transporter substrate binding protein [Hyphomicrobiales bacterium]
MIVRRWLLLLPLLLCQGVAAQGFPSKPIKVVVPYPPGGVVDVIARLVGERMSQNVGQAVVVENRTGAASNIGTEAVARSAPDGYTLVLASPAHTVNISLYPKLGWHPLKSFEPVVMVGVIPSVIVVHPSVAARSLAEIVALAKARPGQLNYASAGPGSSIHLAAEMLKQMAGIYVLHIPYNGQPAALSALMSGDVQMMFLTMALAKSRAEAGQLRPLAVTTPKRSAAMPQLPTVAETYPGFEVSTWFAYLAPAATPAEVVAKLNAEIARAMRHPEVEKKLLGIGAELNPGTPQDLRRFLEADIERWAKVIKQAGIKID